jgi:hypothetical protein
MRRDPPFSHLRAATALRLDSDVLLALTHRYQLRSEPPLSAAMPNDPELHRRLPQGAEPGTGRRQDQSGIGAALCKTITRDSRARWPATS